MYTHLGNRKEILYSKELDEALSEIIEQAKKLRDEKADLHGEIQSLSQERGMLKETCQKLLHDCQVAERQAVLERKSREEVDVKYREAKEKMLMQVAWSLLVAKILNTAVTNQKIGHCSCIFRFIDAVASVFISTITLTILFNHTLSINRSILFHAVKTVLQLYTSLNVFGSWNVY